MFKYGKLLLKKYIYSQSINRKKIDIDHFSFFTYSRTLHFPYFDSNDLTLYSRKINRDLCDLKVYQDLLVYTFIKDNIPEGSKILEIDGGESRIIRTFKNDYECWNLDKLEGIGNGPTSIKVKGFRLVEDYIGNFNRQLPDNYFDFVFSISALEHTPGDEETNRNICTDINRVMKSNALSLHCFDVVLKSNAAWTNNLLPFIFHNIKTMNAFIPFSELKTDTSLYCMSEKSYNRNWKATTQKSYEDFGKPLSYNVLWRKPS